MGLGNSLFCRKLLHILTLFTLSSSTSLQLDLAFPWHAFCAWVVVACFFLHVFPLKYSGARSQRCYSLQLHYCFPFLVFCAWFWSSKLVLCGSHLTVLYSSHPPFLCSGVADSRLAPCLHWGHWLLARFPSQCFSVEVLLAFGWGRCSLCKMFIILPSSKC